MIAALLLGRKGSVGFPGKNVYPVLGRPMAFYPMKAALESKGVDRVYLSTDDEALMELASGNGVVSLGPLGKKLVMKEIDLITRIL